MHETIEVRVGQVWADNDPRSAGRTVRVDHLMHGMAICTVLTNATNPQFDGEGRRDSRGRRTRIALERFRPTASGYVLLRNS
ncbi:hypothetical protein Lfu02_14710 [Longispora fulva]|uniref:Uncharacterized protein n=1 Tax=Longispora fulva TaxID=619741 RepID=A0A8J7GX02_9ACTN|nr:hypothetical protein [Longispora fulva]MBG6140519.1 hypothetical protein [Longispora fulva]GIG57099.1 hypothetical protein Lfu02_14710 [Longispora fulva]